MTPVLVDTSVLLDVATNDPTWGPWSTEMLMRHADEATLVLNPIIYSELSIAYRRIEDLEAAVPAQVYRRETLPYEAAFLAGRAFLSYRRRGGARTSPLPDFYIGAHAAVAGYRLLTRDTRRVESYFPRVRLISP